MAFTVISLMISKNAIREATIINSLLKGKDLTMLLSKTGDILTFISREVNVSRDALNLGVYSKSGIAVRK